MFPTTTPRSADNEFFNRALKRYLVLPREGMEIQVPQGLEKPKIDKHRFIDVFLDNMDEMDLIMKRIAADILTKLHNEEGINGPVKIVVVTVPQVVGVKKEEGDGIWSVRLGPRVAGNEKFEFWSNLQFNTGFIPESFPSSQPLEPA